MGINGDATRLPKRWYSEDKASITEPDKKPGYRLKTRKFF